MNKTCSQTKESKNVTLTSTPTSLLQRKCACGEQAGLTGTCNECQKKSLLGNKPPLIQPKLTISQPNDKYEQEADRVADEVMRMPLNSGRLAVNSPPGHAVRTGRQGSVGSKGETVQAEPESQHVQRTCKECEKEEEEKQLQTKPISNQITPLIQRQAEEEEDEEEVLQTKSISSQSNPLIQRQAEEEEEEEIIQPKPLAGKITPLVQRQVEDEEEEEPVQLKSRSNSGIIQRQDSDDKPKSNKDEAKEALEKTGEAFLETEPGKKIVNKGKDVISTLPGAVITGTVAVGVVTALVATNKELPIQAPAIPLDRIHPGLSMKITVEGPLRSPTKAMISFSGKFGLGKRREHRKLGKTETEKLREENNRKRRKDFEFRESLKTPEEKARDKQRLLDTLSSRLPIPGLKSQEEVPTAEKEKKKKEETPVQRKEANNTHGRNSNTSLVHNTVESFGHPLDPTTRNFMEQRFGYDFSQVKIHTDNKAAVSVWLMNARAYTVGRDIVFNVGQYAPRTDKGKQLLAHELTHVIQQESACVKPLRKQSQQKQMHSAQQQLSNTLGDTKLTTAGPVLQRATWSEVLGNLSEDEAEANLDEILGDGAYDDWLTIEADYDYEMKRAKVNLARFKKFKESSGAIYLERDSDRVARAILDLREEIRKILTNTSVDEERVIAIESVLSVALGVLELDNDALDGTFSVGFAAAFVEVPWVLIGKAAQDLQKSLKMLKVILEKAEKEETEAWIKAVIAGSITAATLLLPQMSLVVRISLAVGQVSLDFMLEGPEQSIGKEVGGKVAPIAELLADGIADIEKLSPGAKSASKITSRGVSTVGLYFNVAEIGTARGNVSEIEAMIEKAEKKHLRLIKVIKANKKKYLIFMNKFGKAQEAIQETWSNARETRNALYDEIADANYDP